MNEAMNDFVGTANVKEQTISSKKGAKTVLSALEAASKEKFAKLTIAARYWLLGMAEHDHKYYKVLEAMEYGAERHNGLRNGGEPEFIHQLGIFHYLRTLHKHSPAMQRNEGTL